jgi:hypothetical protein
MHRAGMTRCSGRVSLNGMRADKLLIVASLFAALTTALAASLCGGAALAQEMQPKPDQPQQQRDESGNQNPQAQNPEGQPQDAVNAMIGGWEFSNADHNKVCHFTFRTEAASGGRRLDVDKNCSALFPSTKDISAWALDNYGDLRLLDKQGQSVIELTEVESGMYDGFAPGEGRFILQTAAAAPVRTAEDMAGDWAIARGAGKPICTLTLVNSPAAAGSLALRVKAGCDPLVTRFNPNAWRMDEGELVLLSARGQSWQFEENDANTWQRVPESADPILLMRQ